MATELRLRTQRWRDSLQDGAILRSRLRPARGQLLRGLLVMLLVVPLVANPLAGPGATRGDQLSDAYAKQRTLEQQIAAQKALIASLQAQQAKTAAAISATTDQLAQVNADLASVAAAVKEATAQLALATSRYYDLVQQLNLLNTQLLWLQATQDRKAAELKVRQDALAQRLQAAYQDSSTPLLAQLLGSGSLNDVLVTISYNLTMGDQDRELAQRISADQAELSAMEATTASLRTQTAALRDEAAAERAALADQRAQLKANQAQLQALQDQTEALVAAQKASYAKLKYDAAQAAAVLAAQRKADAEVASLIDTLLAQKWSYYGIPSSYSGSLHWPMPGTITQEFGCTGFWWEPPLGNCAHFHTGIDIANTMYTPIRSAGDGVVLYVGPNPYESYPVAWIVVVAHSSRLVTWYVHVDNYRHPPPVQAGDHVVTGQIIAYEGMTGKTTGPHLHWGVRFDGTWMNPRLFL
jgi:murein DD-endopeptidase MepM/ murein hydrolase activator NlpD